MQNLSKDGKTPLTQVVVALLLTIGIAVMLSVTLPSSPSQAASEAYNDIENEFEGDAEAIEYGRQRYARRCAYCHGGGGAGAKGPSLTRGKFKYSRKGLTSELYSIIAGGIPNTQMGAFGRLLDGDEILKIIAYIRQESARRAAEEQSQDE